MVLSEDILKIKYRKESFDVFEIEKGTLLTPSAKQFLNEKGIELVIKEKNLLFQLKMKKIMLIQKKKSLMKSLNILGKMVSTILKSQNI